MKDIYAGRYSVFSYGILVILWVLGFAANEMFFAVFILTAGAMCLYNYRSCKRVHCKITGIGFSVIGAVALIKIMGYARIPWDFIWGIFIAVLLAGYIIEYLYHSKTGSRYSGMGKDS